jgi:chromosome segregation protein
MDKGAHFYRCDFQCHTPRDTNWTGKRPQNEVERKTFADLFVAGCRKKRLDAVAITDHHDLCFFPYIKAAAQNEMDSSGDPYPPEKQLVVFPGMELTLAIPCQAILILDSDFLVSELRTLYTALACPQQDHSADRHFKTERLEHIRSLGALCDTLDHLDHLKGRYILLPNVTEGSGSSIIRKGFYAEYKSMPCVGGYVDGSLKTGQKGQGHSDIVNGKNREYGFKAIGIIQTSDNRAEDLSELGKHTSWIKWATPSAEALRQACLARSTRISNSQPGLPAIVIDSVDISNSKFMGPVLLDFNAQLNCLIGGRGTGKSTILEYVRWALCDQPPAIADDEDLPNFQKKRISLIEKTLIPFEAAVTVAFTINGVPHTVRRNARTRELLLKIDDQPFKSCAEEDVRVLIPLQAYSQKQLSAVGVRTDELLRFVLASINKQMTDFANTVESLKTTVRATYGEVHKKRLVEREIERDRVRIASLTKQLETLKSGLVGVSPEDQVVLKDHDVYVKEQKAFADWNREIDELAGLVRSVRREVANLPSAVAEIDKVINVETIREASGEVDALFKEAKDHLVAISTLLEQGGAGSHLEKLAALRRGWDAKFNGHSTAYDGIKEKLTAQQAQLALIETAENELKQANEAISVNRQKLVAIGQPDVAYKKSRQEWAALYKERADLIQERCAELTKLSDGVIKATLRRGAGIEAVNKSLTDLYTGTRVRGAKIDALCRQIADAADSVAEWNNIQNELESLAVLEAQDGKMVRLPATPTLTGVGFTKDELERLAIQLKLDAWLSLSLVELVDEPTFEYRLGEVDYIAFADASAGQQATALLRVLLNQAGPPLIIDQPEEDLDNPVIFEIVRQLWEAKQRRQIIFSSHNANIVVNGDADLVVCCANRKAGDQTGGIIKCQGAIDVPAINHEITAVMEGGKEAFRLRKEKYGF